MTSGFRSGGYLADIRPQPVVRKFPGTTKRRVKVRIHQWTEIGGTHFHVSLEEEDNPAWQTVPNENFDEPHWMRAWDDQDARAIPVGRLRYSR